MKGISLRYKLLAALTVIPLVGLSLFLLLAVTIFEKDKIAYVFDSSLSVSKNRAARVSSEVATMISLTQAIVLTYRSDTKDLAPTGTYYFERELRFDAFQIHAIEPGSSQYKLTVNLKKPSSEKAFEDAQLLLSKLIYDSRNKGIVVRNSPSAPEKLFVAARFGQTSDARHVIAIALFDTAELSSLFTDPGAHMGFLATKADGAAIFASGNLRPDWGVKAIWDSLSGSNASESIAEIKSPDGVTYLASFAEAGVADLVAVSMVEKGVALTAVTMLLRNSVLFFIALISFTTIIAVVASRRLTSALHRLSIATRKVAQGDFEIRVEEKSGGEIGLLATSFNAMAGEVSRLMKETAEKARMESELATAKAVQETLFPQASAQIGPVGISGLYIPASECGGDWWYYFESEDRVFIWIGDATGHGAPAALLTSAARAVASVISLLQAPTVGESLTILNRAICDTSKGSMMMTFFLASIDKTTGVMTYANASHEPPLVLRGDRNKSQPIGREDFTPLIDVNNPRIGEHPTHVYQEASVQLNPGDRLVFYTDGIVDVKNPEQKNWGERRFLKALATAFEEGSSTQKAVGGVFEALESFRSNVPLDDDVTLVLCSFDGPQKDAA